MRRSVFTVVVALASVLMASRNLAQDVTGALASTDRGPRFLMATAHETATLDVSRTPLLRRRISIDVQHVPLRVALDAIAKQAGLSLSFSPDVVNLDTPVTLDAKNLTVAAALTEVLIDLRVDVVFSPSGQLSVVRQPTQPTVGTITGQVTDSSTTQVIWRAKVTVQGTALSTYTDAEGRFTIRQVPVGDRIVSVKFLGYTPATRSVSVVENEAASVTFQLVRSPTVLDKVVTTATGEQRYRELGHVVAQINADSLVKEAPITSLSELLTARVPGLQVLPGNGGVAGGDVALRLRGQTTTHLDPQPIVIVDGVRYKNTNIVNGGHGIVNEDQRPFQAEQRSPLNDLNVNDIETVDVVKGPSASTLYGPDAANGVIVITTKRGKPGKPHWHLYAYPDLSIQPNTAPSTARGYRAWGHDPATGAMVNYNCTLSSQYRQPPECILDSVTVAPLLINTSKYSVLAKSRPQWHSGASVGGGTQTLTYFVSGNYDSQTGALQLSPFAKQFLVQQLGTAKLGDGLQNPNTQQSVSLHTNVSAQVNSAIALRLSAGYTQSTQRSINISNVYSATYQSGVLPPGADTTNPNSFPFSVPVNAFLQTTQQQAHRLTATIGGTVQPTSWLTAIADLGIDLDATVDRGVEEAGAEGSGFDGVVSDYRRDNTSRSANLGLTATAHPGTMSFRTSVGAQYMYTNLDGLNANGRGLAPGSTSISTARSQGTQQVWGETASLGTYGEEVFGLNDRLFVTGSLRLDGSSSFGDAYHPHPYPKVGLSWIVSDEPWLGSLRGRGVDELRLRYSFGASSRYPTSGMKLGHVQSLRVDIEGQSEHAFDRDQLANPLLRPERTQEAEYGADLLVASNVHIALTWYGRHTRDVLNILPTVYNFPSSWGNVGDIAAHGFEATVGTTLLSSKNLGLDIYGSYAHNTNKLLNLGDAPESKQIYGSLVAGYPIDASFGQTIIGIHDTVGGGPDGVILGREVMLSPVHFLGVFHAPNVYTVNPVLSLFGSHIRVSTLFDRQSGGIQRDQFRQDCVFNGLCLAAFVKGTSLLEQAKYASNNQGSFVVSSNFTRWRELSVTTELPQALRQKVWLSQASMSLQVRNLALWTSYKGPDPESVPGLGTVGLQSAYNGGNGIPQARSWTIRFDVSP